MTTKCQQCESGPAGEGGHENLFSHAFSRGKVVMKCRTCGTCWSRRATARDVEWHQVDASVGSLLPSGGG
jgi:uncharacterized Zn finger protein